MKAVVAAFNQEKALVGAFSAITNLRMQLFEALTATHLLNSFNSLSDEQDNGASSVTAVGTGANKHIQTARMFADGGNKSCRQRSVQCFNITC